MSRFRVAGLVSCLAVPVLAAGLIAARAQDGAPRPVTPNMQAPLEQSRAAIADCRARRLRGELKTYQDSAQCSNPKIFAAWRDANYPHMDLITQWLSQREQDSGKVDRREMTASEFEEDMDAMTIRLTAEEQRRRSGLTVSADGDLQLQLPPASQVVGVATPAGDDKQAAKLSTAARQRAAYAVATPASSSGPSVGAMGQVTPLDSGKGKATGGPLVPVPPGPGSSGLYAELTAQRSEPEARSAYRYLQGLYPSALSGRDATIRRADDPNQGTYYRVEIGPMTSSQADQFCGSIKASGGQCVPRYE